MQGFRDAKIQLQKRLFMPIMFPWSDRLVLATQESLRPVRELPLPSGGGRRSSAFLPPPPFPYMGFPFLYRKLPDLEGRISHNPVKYTAA